ncbi:Uncharacterised protein [BD1-7 clade bacterium]|uniref:Uncharacterized protein n=1 Tax=BD1-7 clade bacterium TaxID=2029982 RepID=A0A5S9PIF3_9GAMM|nr:Uncharacterised protein [BD1-7 clade bacterium]
MNSSDLRNKFGNTVHLDKRATQVGKFPNTIQTRNVRCCEVAASFALFKAVGRNVTSVRIVVIQRRDIAAVRECSGGGSVF